MAGKKLNKTSIAALQAPTASEKQEIVFDDDPKGFGVLLSGKTPTKTYIVERTLTGALANGKRKLLRRITIARVGEISLEEARAEAHEIINKLRKGEDPKAERTKPAKNAAQAAPS